MNFRFSFAFKTFSNASLLKVSKAIPQIKALTIDGAHFSMALATKNREKFKYKKFMDGNFFLRPLNRLLKQQWKIGLFLYSIDFRPLNAFWMKMIFCRVWEKKKNSFKSIASQVLLPSDKWPPFFKKKKKKSKTNTQLC